MSILSFKKCGECGASGYDECLRCQEIFCENCIQSHQVTKTCTGCHREFCIELFSIDPSFKDVFHPDLCFGCNARFFLSSVLEAQKPLQEKGLAEAKEILSVVEKCVSVLYTPQEIAKAKLNHK